MTSKIFETNRLLVRQLTELDFPSYFEMQGNPNVHRYTCSPVDDEPVAFAGLQKHIDAYGSPDNDWWIWCIERKDDAQMVGTCAIVASQNQVVGEGPEIGYRFLEKYWGKGYAKEICDPLIQHALETMQLPSVFATVDIANVASVKILEKSQLKFVAEYYNNADKCTDRVYFLESSSENSAP